jgi:hypothetical protein
MIGGGVACYVERARARDADAGEPFVGIDPHENEVVNVATAEGDFPSGDQIMNLMKDGADFCYPHVSPFRIVFKQSSQL